MTDGITCVYYTERESYGVAGKLAKGTIRRASHVRRDAIAANGHSQ
jgi:hypothetical protein